jgi:pimeloyl-ACP methyl ester carboxylesterase
MSATATDADAPVLRRRFVVSDGRLVHFWTGGTGPAILLMHGSPGNAWLVKPLAERLARSYSVYAVDTPGFGASEPLPGDTLTVAHLADAYCGILDGLGLARISVYGTHSGAAIGLELARRHPGRVCSFVLEGVPAFTPAEQEPLLAPEYMLQFEPDVLGGHYARAWTRFHDQFLWFPWYQRMPAQLNEADAGSAAEIHLWVEMYFQAIRHEYRPAYRAVIGYGAAALAAAAEVSAPGVYLAERSDMLFPHLDRLPALHPGQRIERVDGTEGLPTLIESAFQSQPKPQPHPHPQPLPAAGMTPDAASAGSPLSFFDLPRGQILIRNAGAATLRPWLLLHDAPGSGRQLQPLYRALALHRQVMLPDLPGCGESDPLDASAPDLRAYADALAQLLNARVQHPVDIYAVGHGAALALELNARHPALVRSLLLTGLLRCAPSQRRTMIGRLAPPINLADDGSHWYRTWLMLRDSLVRWPWYARERAALRRQQLAFDAGQLHEWTCDVMRQWHSYHHLIDAVLAWHPDDALAAARGKLTIVIDPLHALHASDAEWAAAGGVDAVTLPPHAADQAALLADARERQHKP